MCGNVLVVKAVSVVWHTICVPGSIKWKITRVLARIVMRIVRFCNSF